jgi:hypothetical protein
MTLMSAPLFWVARTLQLSGLVTTLWALPAGFLAEESKRMTYELGLLVLGAAVFCLGRWMEGSTRH